MQMPPFIEQILKNPVWATILMLWTLAWKGYALWRAAKNEQKFWFVPMFVVNLLGIPEIIYLLFFQTEGRLIDKIFRKK